MGDPLCLGIFAMVAMWFLGPTRIPDCCPGLASRISKMEPLRQFCACSFQVNQAVCCCLYMLNVLAKPVETYVNDGYDVKIQKNPWERAREKQNMQDKEVALLA